MSEGLLLASPGVLIAGAGICAVWSGHGKAACRLGAAVSAIGALLAMGPAASVLWTGRQISFRLPWQVPFGTLHVVADPLSSLFILAISVVCALSAVYGTAYLKVHSGRKNLGAAWCFFNLLFASMLLVVMARNAVLFLFAWEAMSLSSFFLVMFDHEKPAVREAGWIYLTAAHLGTACLLVLFLLMGGRNSTLDFDGFAQPTDPVSAGALFLLAVAGFGAKAGFLPMHVWLPEAHPAAPSHVSAVMSGVMIKTGIYGLVRVLSMLGAPAPWWGWTMLAIGAASGIMGVLFALAQHDFKRLLAYHSVENIGIICLGLGLWLLGMAAQDTFIAALGLMGGLLHVCNHALFKALLFLGAGAVVHATGTGNLDSLGGLQKRMPHTALTFAVGSVAICGLPPLNGFVSEFLIYLGAYGMLQHSPFSGNLAAGLITLISLGLIGGLAAACFAKVFGIVFLGEPRSRCALEAHEAERPMRQAMAALAGLCILLGLAAPFALELVAPVAVQLLGISPAPAVGFARGILQLISLAGGLLIFFTVVLWGLRRRLLTGRTVATGPTWDCGYAAPDAKMQYTASSFAWPVIQMFRWLLRPRLQVQMERGLFPERVHLTSHSRDLFREAFFAPVFRSIDLVSRRLRWLQQGRNQYYVLYIAVTILALLLMKVRG